MTKQRYNISRGGNDEPGLILIGDSEKGVIVARSSEMALSHVQDLVRLANAACAVEPKGFIEVNLYPEPQK